MKNVNLNKKTNKKMMILSFFGILLVVQGHIGSPIKLANDLFPIYSFHMALFIFISGYFYKNDNEQKLLGKNGYIIKKFKKLVIPYFIWNAFYATILFILKETNTVTFGSNINFKTFFVDPWIHGHQYILNIPAWFMLSLFLVNISYVLIRKILNKLWNDNLAFILFLGLSLLSIYFFKNNVNQSLLPLGRTCFFLFFYQFGYIYKTKLEGRIKINSAIYFFVIVVLQLFMLKFDPKLSYVVCTMKFSSKYLITPIVSSITGILFWLKISEILEPSLGNSKVVNFIGNYTSDIMIHHLFWSFLSNLAIWKLSGVFHLEGFNVNSFKTTIYYFYMGGFQQAKMFYAIVAIAMPLIFRYMYNTLKDKIVLNLEKRNEEKYEEI